MRGGVLASFHESTVSGSMVSNMTRKAETPMDRVITTEGLLAHNSADSRNEGRVQLHDARKSTGRSSVGEEMRTRGGPMIQQCANTAGVADDGVSGQGVSPVD